MIAEHCTHPDLLAKRVHVSLVGAGGNGSQMLTGLARLNAAIAALGHPGLRVTVYDPDDVSESNLGRQLYAPADIGRNKASVLVTRTNVWFGTHWKAVPYPFGRGGFRHYDADDPDIVVSCVDSARARVAVAAEIETWYAKPFYWLDLGNRAADGQVVLGIPPWNKEHAAYEYRLPTVLELFPELETHAGRFDRDNAPSCSLAQALERQELFVNQSVVTPALQLLWQIFRYGRTTWCGAFVNAARGRVTPLPIDPQAWARLGYVRPSVPEKKKGAKK